ncbi:hypothetical protein EV356DRAFT_449566 [Viridothelium virens]|uniref:Rhodopsin domain-containing protein n=1 Tax=Viridothelium virens TaxID=1048519 RepID=A0A6A6H4B9_VIRVR|nr:hypothetical protein EV356DRAFT_449566 [Viridothelium virens]
MTWGSGSPPIAAAEAPAEIQWKSLAPSVATTALATFVVALRFYTRITLVRAVGRDDGVVLFSLLLSIAMCAIVGAVAVGSSSKYQPHRNTRLWTIAKLVVANNCLYAAITNLTKASILLQYLRVFSSRIIRYIAWTLMFLCVVALAWAIFGGVFLCTPVGKLWQPEIPGWCMNAEHYWVSTAAANVFLDFSVLILPMPVISTINLPKRQKAALIFIFLLGGFGAVVSLVRLLVVHLEATKGRYLDSGIEAITWSAVEANTGIICASLMALKPLVVHFFPRLMLSNEPARRCMRLPRISSGVPEMHTVNCGHKFGSTQSGSTSQQTVVPENAHTGPSARRDRKKSSIPSEVTVVDSPMIDYGETASRSQWRVSQYGWPPGTAL